MKRQDIKDTTVILTEIIKTEYAGAPNFKAINDSGKFNSKILLFTD
jgi:hypothetical protein